MADDRCVGCASRRVFLSRVSGAVLAAMAGVDVSAADGSYEVTEVSASSIGPSTVTMPLPAGDGVTIERKAQIILVRFQGKVIAFNLSCPHENAAVRWKPAVSRFECTKHDSKYAPDGRYIGGRSTRNMDRLAITRVDATVVVDLTRLIKSDANAAEWAAATLTI